MTKTPENVDTEVTDSGIGLESQASGAKDGSSSQASGAKDGSSSLISEETDHTQNSGEKGDGFSKSGFSEAGSAEEAQGNSLESAPALSETLASAGSDEAEDSVRLVMTGDILMHDRIIAAGKKEDGSYDYSFIFDKVRELTEGADLAMVNQETILGGGELGLTGYPSFNSPYEVGDAEAEAGFDVILHATNHALDRSARGIENCVSFWETMHPDITYLGIRDSSDGENDIFITEVNGIRLAVLNYTYGTNGIRPPAGKEYLVNLLNEKKIISDLDRAEKEADLTVVCPHWGTEYSQEVSSEQKKWAELFLEHGADVVIGTHPHVIEPIEMLTDEEGHRMLVYYSIGNFINATSGTGAKVTPRMVGGIADVLIKKGSDGKAYVESYGAYPVICHLTVDSAAVYFIDEYNEELASQNRIRVQDPDFSYQACRDVVTRIWGEEYAPEK